MYIYVYIYTLHLSLCIYIYVYICRPFAKGGGIGFPHITPIHMTQPVVGPVTWAHFGPFPCAFV